MIVGVLKPSMSADIGISSAGVLPLGSTNRIQLVDATEVRDSSNDTGSYDGSLPLYDVAIED